jgi:hypothetical protein
MIGHDLAWEVVRPSPSGEHVGNRTRFRLSISLRQLNPDEVLGIELFALSDFAEQSGLPGLKRDREEKQVGKLLSTREINELFAQRGLSPLPE